MTDLLPGATGLLVLADGTVIRNVESFNLSTGSGDDSLSVDETAYSRNGYWSAGAGTDVDFRLIKEMHGPPLGELYRFYQSRPD